ncbi:protein-arginine deiminase type-3-like [Ahaetulla prasina]|uniref:protein-arginine deiminase type-3-like n=1 Tax=Ahaetulla prasina TaxID=499056 RepID=UPI0026491B18|nr:protein-arginine deiminase type-3-like [Ahaetulla prasina]
MTDQRYVQLSTEKVTSAVHILGTELYLDILEAAPRAATCFEIWATHGLNIYKTEGHTTKPTKSKVYWHDSKWPLDQTVKFSATLDAPSEQVDDEKIRVSYYEGNGKVPIAKAILHITCIEMSLDADINRSGTVTRGGDQKDQWTWGPDGKGAILLVNCDRDNPTAKAEDNKDIKLTSKQDLQDMSRMILTTQGPNEVFANYQLTLHISKADGDKVGVFYAQEKKEKRYYKHVLGSGKISYRVKWNPGQRESVFYVEGLKFPDIDFSGLVTFHASLLEPTRELVKGRGIVLEFIIFLGPHLLYFLLQGVPETSIFMDTLVFRVAPWIMTPNTLQPVAVYVCSVGDNKDFVEHIRKLATKAGCKFIICPKEQNRGDRWIQDEMEFGYIQAPHKTFPVVFDSPRNKGLNYFPFKEVLGPDFGYVKREQSAEPSQSSLDAFGNLEVSPPVNVKGKEYPLGRILIGAALPSSNNAPMSKLVKDFLYGQVVQSPIELYTDWLVVGHVDEFLSFVPAPDQKVWIRTLLSNLKELLVFSLFFSALFLTPLFQGFRLLLASPRACFKLLEEKEKEGHGKARMPEGDSSCPLQEIRTERKDNWEAQFFQRMFHFLKRMRSTFGLGCVKTDCVSPFQHRLSTHWEQARTLNCYRPELQDQKDRSISEIIADRLLRQYNDKCQCGLSQLLSFHSSSTFFPFQKCIDWNRKTLKEELGLAEEDIIEIPQLFQSSSSFPKVPVSEVLKVPAGAYFPDMVRLQLLCLRLPSLASWQSDSGSEGEEPTGLPSAGMFLWLKIFGEFRAVYSVHFYSILLNSSNMKPHNPTEDYLVFSLLQVNMIVLGKHLGIPKPFGPIIDGQCCLEKEVRRLLEPLGLSCNFIDDYGTYYFWHGDVHCGTNVRRKPFSFKWWNMRP